MNCPNCRHENAPSAKFCSECGTKLQPVCPQCGSEVAPAAKFCSECGASLTAAMPAPSPPPPAPAPQSPPTLEQQFTALHQALPASLQSHLLTPAEGENRIVTVLFADMSRSVETMRNLPAEEAAALVNRLLKAMVDALLKYEGRVDRFLGDGVLAVFGVPQAHESDPERAILAAIDIREAARQLELDVTAGINTGEVYAGGMGSERHHEVTVMGPAVNLAARLQGEAEPGQILVGEATHRQTRRAFGFRPLALEIKGIPEPVIAYQVLRPLPRPEKTRGIEGLRAPLIGREKELCSLIECAEALLQERQGQIATLIGEAGIGKTRLVSELKEYLAGKEICWLEGRCISIGQSVSFWPFIDMMRTYLGLSGEDPEQEIAARLVRKLTDLFPQDAEGIIPYLGQMLSVNLEERYQQRIQHAAPEQIRRQTLLRMRDFFVALARRQRLVVILEDLHWADDLSLDLLWVLMDELVAAPILLVCVYRPEQDHGCWKIDGAASSKHLERYTSLFLKPLTPHESQEMVASLLDIQNLPSATRATILENTEGNPFYVEEVVRFLMERGIIYREDGSWKAKETIGALTVPDTVRSVILSRIDRLHADVRSVLQCAAVIGRVFQRRLLEYLSDQSGALEQHLSQLEAHELVYKERILPELEYAFKHALTQETAYEGILSRHRRAIHERVGQGIEALYQEQLGEYYELLAFHYSRSDNRKKAVEYLAKAGQKAAARYANHEALDYFERALELAQGTEASEAILADRAKVRLALFQGEAAACDYERLLQSARQSGNQRQELEALLGLAGAFYVMALDDQEADFASRCRECYRAAYTRARELDDKRNMVRALVPTIWFLDFWPEYYEQAAANVEEALALSSEIGDEELVIDSLLAKVKVLWMLARLEMAEEQGENLLGQLETRHDLLRLKEVYFRLMWIHNSRGNFQRAVDCADAGIKLAGETGVPPVQFPTMKALALINMGRYGDAWASLQEEPADEHHPFGRAMKNLGTATYFFELMASDRAAAVFGEVLEQAGRLRREWMRRWVQMLLARTLVQAGEMDEEHRTRAVLDLESMSATPSAEIMAGIRVSDPVQIMAEVRLSERKLDEALQLVEKSSVQAQASGRKRDGVSALQLKMRILLQLERPRDVVALADEVLPVAEKMSYLPMVWRIRAAKAQALSMLGTTEAAAREYRAAAAILRKLADTIGDTGLKQGFLSDPLVSSILAAAKSKTRRR